MADYQNLSDLNIIGVDVFSAPIGATPSYLGSFDANNNYTGLAYGSNVMQSAQTYINNAWNTLTQSGGSLFGSTPVKTVPASSASAATGAAVPSTTAPAASSSTNASGTPTPVSQGGTTNPGQSDTGSASTPGTLQNYFMRAVIIIVGFIALAIGLNMLKPGVVPDPRSMVR